MKTFLKGLVALFLVPSLAFAEPLNVLDNVTTTAQGMGTFHQTVLGSSNDTWLDVGLFGTTSAAVKFGFQNNATLSSSYGYVKMFGGPLAVTVDNTGNAWLGGAPSLGSFEGAVAPASTVNVVKALGTITGSAPILTVGGANADANVNISVKGNGTGIVALGQTICTVAASGNAGTCNGQRGIYTTASLTTAHSAAATAQVITNSSVTASSLVLCSVNAYSGAFGTNGNPTVACVPTSNTITATVVNAADTNALAGTVGIGFVVLN